MLVGVQLSLAGSYLPPLLKDKERQYRICAIPTPDDHFGPGPNRGMTVSRNWCVR